MTDNNCLNCGHPVSGNYCGHCGQKASTHRFTLKHVFTHDLIHGALHLDKGFPYTAMQLIKRPGYAVREYIEGKRANYFNAITFLLLFVALDLFVETTTNFHVTDIAGVPDANNILDQIDHIRLKYKKEIYLVTIPLYSLITYTVFYKAKLNYAEHLVLHTYKEGGTLMISIIGFAIIPFIADVNGKRAVFVIVGLIANIWTVWFLWQAFKKDYSQKWLLVLTIIGFYILSMTVMVLLGYALKWSFGL